MFDMFKPNKQGPKVFVVTPAYARGVIEKSLAQSAVMIAAAETLLGERTGKKDKEKLLDFIETERSRVTTRSECLTLLGSADVACSVEELVEFNAAFPRAKTGSQAPREVLIEALEETDED